MLIGKSVQVANPHKDTFIAMIVSEPSMTVDGEWFVCVTSQGKITSVDVYFLTLLT